MTVHCKWCNPLHLPVATRTTTSSFRQQPRLYCSTDVNQVRRPTFSVVGPTVWNSLPEYVRSTKAVVGFKRNLEWSHISLTLHLINFYHWLNLERCSAVAGPVALYILDTKLSLLLIRIQLYLQSLVGLLTVGLSYGALHIDVKTFIYFGHVLTLFNVLKFFQRFYK